MSSRDRLQAGSFIQTVSGRRIDPLAPDPGQIEIGDIAQALSNQCRFGGHCRVFYSVAQHSVLVSDLLVERGATAADALAGLLHDASEAYLVDLPHPLKHRSELGALYREAEQRLQQTIRHRFSLPAPAPLLKEVDRSLLATERRLFTGEVWHWPELEGYAPLELEIEPLGPPEAAASFLAGFERLDTARADSGGASARRQPAR